MNIHELYAELALEAVRQRKMERRAEKRFFTCIQRERDLAWEDMADAYDQAKYCRYLLCEPDQFGQSSVSYS